MAGAMVRDAWGNTWQIAKGVPTGAVKRYWHWNHPLAADRVDGKKFYLHVGNEFFRSDDGGFLWTAGVLRSAVSNGIGEVAVCDDGGRGSLVWTRDDQLEYLVSENSALGWQTQPTLLRPADFGAISAVTVRADGDRLFAAYLGGGRPKKGIRMAGQMGNERVTVRSVDLVQADKDKNLLVVKVDNRRDAADIPTPLTDWHNYGGLTRDVLLVQVPETHVSSYELRLDGELAGDIGDQDGHLLGIPENVRLPAFVTVLFAIDPFGFHARLDQAFFRRQHDERAVLGFAAIDLAAAIE